MWWHHDFNKKPCGCFFSCQHFIHHGVRIYPSGYITGHANSSTLCRCLYKYTRHACSARIKTAIKLIGVTNTQNSNQQIEIKNLRFQRYELVGTLTEIRLVLTADVIFTANDGRKLSDSVQVEHSYQYNEASVTPQDQQGEQVKPWLYDELAKRITQKYHAFALEAKSQ